MATAAGPWAEFSSLPLRRPRPASRRRSRRVIAALLGLTALVAVARCSVIDWFRVTGPSMAPALASGDLIVCNRLAYGLRLPGMSRSVVQWAEPQVGDLVIFPSPDDGVRCVKRVAAPPSNSLPAGCVWVLGDNSEESRDSRDHGPVPIASIDGRLITLR
jgi:signal peptidase I